MSKVACISGITGQTGSYLADLLLSEGYTVFGLKRSASNFNTQRINHLFDNPNLKLVYGDLSDYSSIVSFITEAKPDLFFNTAALSHVRVSFDIPEYTMDITGTGVIRCLEALRKYSPNTRFLQCSTSELYGGFLKEGEKFDEESVFHPRSPYACAKIAGYWATINYREAYGMFAVNTISFNHEGPRRAENFVTRKITRAATRIKLGLQENLKLGNINAQRDWGHAADTARAMYMVLTAEEPDDYVVATGEMYSVEEFLEKVFSKLDLKWQDYVVFDDRYLRPSEVDALCGDSTKLRQKLGWEPKYTFDQLVDEMVEHDLELAKKEKA